MKDIDIQRLSNGNIRIIISWDAHVFVQIFTNWETWLAHKHQVLGA